jgi:membrane-bound lytic murein transglycosylase D
MHTVQSGDTLWDIAKKYPGISVNDLKNANSSLNFNRLKPGQKIKIPPTT